MNNRADCEREDAVNAQRSDMHSVELTVFVGVADVRGCHVEAFEVADLLITLTSKQAERSIDAYNHLLQSKSELTDAAILNSWQPLLKYGVPDGQQMPGFTETQ